jgi:hypothetical protein
MDNHDDDKKLTAFSELCRFASSVGYSVELDKPFVEFEKLILRVYDSEGEELYKVILNDISEADEQAGNILNFLSKKC